MKKSNYSEQQIIALLRELQAENAKLNKMYA